MHGDLQRDSSAAFPDGGLEKPGSEKLLISVEELCKAINTGRTFANQLIRDNEVESVKLGSRRLVVYASVEALIERLKTEQAR